MEIAYTSGIEYSGLSEIGPVREDNQDSIRLSEKSSSPETGCLFALADGMGGYEYGKLASETAIHAMFQTFYGHFDAQPQRRVNVNRLMHKGMEAANLAVCTEARKRDAHRMGTTLTAAGIVGNTLYLAHVGDSRAYLVRDCKAQCLTSDHTVVGDLLRMKVLRSDQVRTHARRSILTRAVGLALFIQPEVTQISLQNDDRLILCSDGLWSVIEDDEFASLAAECERADHLCQKLTELALQRETDDNASVIVICVRDLQSGHRPNASRMGWLRNLLPTFANGGQRNGRNGQGEGGL